LRRCLVMIRYLLTPLLFLLPTLAAAPKALINGHIVTVDESFSVVEAMLIEGDRIVKTGSNAEVRDGLPPGAEVIDLKGATVLPGLIDSHVHSTGASTYEFDHVIPEMETIADVLSYIRERARLLPEGTWIGLSQVFITRLQEQRFPTLAELDEAAPKHPVVFRTGPDAALNSLALSLSGI